MESPFLEVPGRKERKNSHVDLQGLRGDGRLVVPVRNRLGTLSGQSATINQGGDSLLEISNFQLGTESSMIGKDQGGSVQGKEAKIESIMCDICTTDMILRSDAQRKRKSSAMQQASIADDEIEPVQASKPLNMCNFKYTHYGEDKFKGCGKYFC